MSLNYIPRVTQLDAVQLDEQVEDLFKQHIFLATKYLEPGVLQPILPEIELLIRTLIFKYSIQKNNATFGQQMLSLKYKTDNFSRIKLYWYYGYTVGLKYLKERSIYSFTTNTKIQNFIQSLETFQLFCDVGNFLQFIQSGKYPVLIDLILGLEMSADQLTREDLTDLSWTRELLWHNFIELIGTVLSLMNLFGVKRKLSNVLKYVWWRSQGSKVMTGGTPIMNIHTLCPCCSGKPVIPYFMGCSHVFCYYCLMANKIADEDYACPKCNYNGKDMKKYTVE